MNCESQWMTSFLPQPISRVKYSHPSWCLERPLGISWSLFEGVIYRESRGFFYCITFFQPFPIFIAYSCSWRDCALGELLIYLGKIIIPMILCSDLYSPLFKFIIFLGRKTQKKSCKNFEQRRNSVISPLSCCEPLQC